MREQIVYMGDYYTLNGEPHRTNGPAIADQFWYLYGRMHRYYGPREPIGEWWVHGRCIKK